MALAMGMPLCLASDPLAAVRDEAELGVAVYVFQRTLLAVEYVVPPLVDGDTMGER